MFSKIKWLFSIYLMPKHITQVELLFDDCVKTASGGYNLAFVNQS